MQDPRSSLRYHLDVGKQLLGRLRKLFSSKEKQELGRLGRALFDPAPIARHLTGMIFNSATSQEARNLEREVDQWLSVTQAHFHKVSVARPSMSTRGNSHELVAKLARVAEAYQPATKLRRGIALLESVLTKQLVYNSEILEYLKGIELQKAHDARLRKELRLLDLTDAAPGMEMIKFPNRAALDGRFADFPEEAHMLSGAIDAYLGDGPDRFTIALRSCRNALENMARRITSTPFWKNAIALVADEAVRKMIKGTFEYLSSKGTHASRPATERQARYGITSTINAMIWFADHQTDVRQAQATA